MDKNMPGNYIRTKEHKEKMIIACKRRFNNGWIFPEKTRQKIKEANASRLWTSEMREKERLSHLGKKHSEKTRIKMITAAHKGKDYYVCGESGAGYRTVHRWVETWKGKPNKCKNCGKIGNGHQMHWANISRKYLRKLNDWIRLCVKCHKAYDLGRLELSCQ